MEPSGAGLLLPAMRSAAPVRGTPAAGWLGLAVVGVTGTLIAAGAARTPALLPESIRPAPAQLSGALSGTGVNLHLAGAVGLLLLMFAGYALVVHLADQAGARPVIIAILALHVLMVLGPPLISTDVFSYQAYARMGARYGVSPYLYGPDAIRLDAVFPYVGARWSAMPSAYGPVFTAASYALAPLSVAMSVLVCKALAAAASLGVVALVWRCAPRRDVHPVRAIALVGLNPLLVVYGVGGGHNDLLMLLALTGSVAMILTGRRSGGGALGVLAVAIKLTGGLVLPFALADGGRSRGLAARGPLLTGAAAALTVITVLSLVLFGPATLHLISTVSHIQSAADPLSIPGAVHRELGRAALGHLAGEILLGGFLLVCLSLLIAVWRGRIDWVDGAAWATLTMLVASSALEPWYVVWLLPLAALARDPRLRGATLALTGLVQGIELLGSLPHG